MKDPQLHALNIVTLAAWLSVCGFAAIAIGVPSSRPMVLPGTAAENATELGDDFTLGDATAARDGEDKGADAQEEPAPTPLPTPPPLPARTRLAALPEIPRPVAPVRRLDPGNAVAARLAAGHTPGPSYPTESRRAGQAGTVVVQFTVDDAGDVRDAKVYTSSRWPLLDREALRTVRSWKFPPGDTMSLIRPIAFQLP
ncbi:MAG: energy transducer TonB [Verrucomicrobiota bacterium]